MELGQFDIEYKPRSSVKGQALADFILEFPLEREEDAATLESVKKDQVQASDDRTPAVGWKMNIDRAVNKEGVRADIVLISPEGPHMCSAIHFDYRVLNNEAEYEALISGIRLELEMKVENILIRSDFLLVVNRMNGEWQAKGPQIDLYLHCTQQLLSRFNEAKLEAIPREKNEEADALAKMGSQKNDTLLGVIPLEI